MLVPLAARSAAVGIRISVGFLSLSLRKYNFRGGETRVPNAAFLPPSLLPSFLFAPDKIYGSWYLRVAERLEREWQICMPSRRVKERT